MKIAYVLSSYLPVSLGGTEVYTSTLAKHVKGLGHEVYIVIPDYINDKNEFYLHEEIPVYKYYESSKSTRELILGLKQPNGVKNFVALINSLKPDIVHFQMISYGTGITIYHLLELKKLGYICGLTIHLAHYTCLTETLLKYNNKTCDGEIKQYTCTSCYLNSKKIILPLAFSIALIQKILQYFPFKIYYQYKYPVLDIFNYAVNRKTNLHILEKKIDFIIPITEWYKKVLVRNQVDSNKLFLIKQGLIPMNLNTNSQGIKNNRILNLVFIGRIVPVKGLHIFLEALIGINNKLYQFDIYGDFEFESDYYQKCENLTKKNNLSVSFLGKLNRDIVYSKLLQYDFLCLPSLFSEMSPLVIQEAFKAKIPVIGSNVPGITEEIQHLQNGIIFPFGNYKKLRELIGYILKNRDIQKKLANKVITPRSFDHIAQEMLDVYWKFFNDAN